MSRPLPHADVHGRAGDPLAAGPDRLGGGEPAPLLDAPVRFSLGSRVPAADGPLRQDLAGHVQARGPRPDATRGGRDALVQTLERSGLTGHGGGHFPVAAKWRTALGAGGGGVVVANCAESEPASAKDAALVHLRPHLVLDGLALAAEAMGTRRAVIWMHEGDLVGRRAIGRAVLERRRDSALDVTFDVELGRDHYLTGESSTIVNALSGRAALPFLPRQHAAHSGVGGRPTLIHNAETLARVALVARTGSAPGGPLVTVVGPGARSVVAAGVGETFAGVVGRSGVIGQRPAAVLLGGYGGSWLPWADLADLPVSDAAVRRVGGSLGAGVVAVLSAGRCGLTETVNLLGYLAGSSAGQCGPCVFGLPALADLFGRLSAGRCSRADLRRLDLYAAQVSGRGACHHPDGVVRLVRSALRVFAADVRQHLAGAPCAGAGVAPFLPVPAVPR